MTELGQEEADAVLKLIDTIEQDDDVQKVFHNLG
jgi:transcriptional/translational regulatory protein YebC/TACO1